MTGPGARDGRAVLSPFRMRSPLEQLRRDPPEESHALLGLVLLSMALFGVSLVVGGAWAPPGLQALPLLLGGLLLRRGPYLRLSALCAVAVVVQLLTQEQSPPGALIVVAFTAAVSYEFSLSREETGLGGLRGDSVLVELQDRLGAQGRLPALPAPWSADSLVKAAGDAPFAGDFVVSMLTADRLEVALVDVSGKGVEAGTRSLLLSGALGGLLGAQSSRPFLSVSNDYLIRQAWEEGFATAAHCSLDLRSGAFRVTSAGHPPVARFDAGSGRWSLLDAAGPALGLLPGVDYTPCTGVLRPGDALLMYTDGLVEVPGRDLALGIDKLLGEAERMVARGFAGGTVSLADGVAASGSDDRGLVLLRRLPH